MANMIINLAQAQSDEILNELEKQANQLPQYPELLFAIQQKKFELNFRTPESSLGSEELKVDVINTPIVEMTESLELSDVQAWVPKI